MDAAYDDQVYVDDRTIDSHIKRLRKKFKVVADEFDAIETLYGVGYRYKELAALFPHCCALTWRILAVYALARLILTGGVIGVQSSGRGLVEERLAGFQQQAAIVASALGL